MLTHEAAGLRDRGIAGTLAWDPPPSTGRGPKLTLTQTIGAGASGGKDALLSRTTLEGLAANDNGEGRRRLEARFGYGFGMFEGQFTGTPEIGLGLSEAARDYSLGWRLTRAGSGAGSLEFSLEARRAWATSSPCRGSSSSSSRTYDRLQLHPDESPSFLLAVSIFARHTERSSFEERQAP